MKRPPDWSRSAWFHLPREARRNRRALLAWCVALLKGFYAEHTAELILSMKEMPRPHFGPPVYEPCNIRLDHPLIIPVQAP